MEKQRPSLNEMINQLPPNLKKQVEEYIKKLWARSQKKTNNAPRFDWAGELKDLKNEYSSVELQHYISRNRGNL